MLKKHVKIINILFIIIVLLMASFGCQSNEGDKVSGNAVEEESLIVNLAGGTDYGYPTPYAHYTRGPGFYKMELIYDSLLERGEEGIIPWLAKDWEVSDDGKTYTFSLQENVKWHDGQDMTAEDVKFSFEYALEYPPVRNHLLMDGQTFVESINTLDGTTVEIKVNQPIATILESLGSVRIIPKHIWENVDKPETYISEGAAIGCGPYKLTEYNQEQGLYQFTAFEDYWGPDQNVDILQFIPVPNDPLIAFQNGEIDLTSITPDVLPQFENDNNYTVVQNPPFWGYRLMLNMEKNSELLDKETRQAIAYAINENEIIEKVARGAGTKGSAGYLPDGHIWYNPNVKTYDADIEKAKDLLDGKELSLSLISGNSNIEVRIAELVKINLEKVGIKINIESMDTKSRDSAFKKGEYEMLIYGSGGIGNDADILRTAFTKVGLSGEIGQSNGIPGYNNEELNELAKKQLFEMDEAERKELIFEMQEIISEEVPIIFLYNTRDYMVYKSEKYDGWKYMYNHHSLDHGKISFLNVE